MILSDIAKINSSECHTFADFARDKLPMPGDKKRLDEILNKEILVVDFRITNSKKKPEGKCLQIQFVLNNQVCVAFTGSVVLIDQIQSARDKMPFRGTIVKMDRYYSLS